MPVVQAVLAPRFGALAAAPVALDVVQAALSGDPVAWTGALARHGLVPK